MRLGPSRLTSTAGSSGESKDTVAAEWMTMSQDAEGGAAGVVEAEPVGADVAGDRRDPSGDQLGEAVLAELLAEAVEGVVAEDLALGPLLARWRVGRGG